jgi:hypothetical protein
MSLKTQFATLSDDEIHAVKSAVAHLDQARAELQEAVVALGRVPKGFESERSKLGRSADGLMWERRAVADRLAEIESRAGKRAAV